MVSTMKWLQNHLFVLNLQKFQMFNLDSQETSAATIPLFLTFCSAEIFVVKEKYFASALQVTVIEYALPSHHPIPPSPTQKNASSASKLYGIFIKEGDFLHYIFSIC